MCSVHGVFWLTVLAGIAAPWNSSGRNSGGRLGVALVAKAKKTPGFLKIFGPGCWQLVEKDVLRCSVTWGAGYSMVFHVFPKTSNEFISSL